MSSPRSMWSGSVSLGMVSMPITIAKAWSDEREKNLRDVCSCHGEFIDRTERCSVTKNAPDGKAKGVELESGKIRVLTEAEYAEIEDASASDALEIVDYQSVYELPMEFGTGTYYVRYNPPKAKSKVGLDVLATFVKALAKDEMAAVVWWKRSGSWKLCALHVGPGGELLLTQLPLANELRPAAEKELQHVGIPTDDGAVALFGQLLGQIAHKEFDLSRFENEALSVRQRKVEQILTEDQGDGKKRRQRKPEQKQKDEGEKVPDLMRLLQDSMKDIKQTEGEKA